MATITIALATTDPLYRAPGTNGTDDPGVTKMTVTRATIAGTDANGDPNYVNHTSPFIDQSQTYGSDEQITQILRKWVSNDGGVGLPRRHRAVRWRLAERRLGAALAGRHDDDRS